MATPPILEERMAEISTPAQPAPTSEADDLATVLETLRIDFAQRADQFDRTGEFPHINFRELHQHGLLSLTVPKRFGGSEAPLRTLAQVIASVARGDPSTALILAMQYLFCDLAARSPGWREAQRDLVFRSVLDDGALINGLRVEPDLGTPARGGLPATIARRSSDGWSISGRKIYSTGSPGLTWMLVWARSDEPVPRVGGWLVPRNAAGVSIVDSWDHLGMRATGSHEVVLDNVQVPLNHALDIKEVGAHQGRLDEQFSLWNTVLISTLYDAVARNARDWFIQWLKSRKPANLGASLSTLERFQEAVGRIDSLLFANQVLLDAAIAGPTTQEGIGYLKYLTSSNSIAVVEETIKLSGNPGLSRGNPLERYYRDVLCSRIHTPQNDSILSGAGKLALAQR
jgi:alkylation response protein AidB-like acyl-CoA dehydrogenase